MDLASTAYHARTGRDLEDDLKAGNHQTQIASALSSIWPSLPGGSQSNSVTGHLRRVACCERCSLLAGRTVMSRWTCICTAHRRARRQARSGTGAVSTSPPRIEHSMPMVGGPWS